MTEKKDKYNEPLLGICNIIIFACMMSYNYFISNYYNIITWEVYLFTLIFITLLIIPWILAYKIGRTGIYYFALLLLFVSLTIKSEEMVSEKILSFIRNITTFKYVIPLCYIVILIVITVLFRKKLGKFVFIVLASMLITTLVKYQFKTDASPTHTIHHQVSGAESKNLPNIIILILDEHIGVKGIPEEYEKGRALKEDLVNQYAKEDFRIYGSAYSNYGSSYTSIGSIMNYRLRESIQYEREGSTRVLKNNQLFEKLSQEGYKIDVYQSTYMNFCESFNAPIRKCFTYHNNALGYLEEYPIPITQRIVHAFSYFIHAHHSRPLKMIYNALRDKLHIPGWDRVGPMAAMSVFHELKKDIAINEPGVVHFAHVLMPHYPYTFDANCKVTSIKKWEDRRERNLKNTEEERDRKYSYYYDQTRCLHAQLSEIYSHLKSQGRYKDTTIVLFGDHGSRICSDDFMWTDQYDRMTTRDKSDMYSTFLAIKNGGYNPEYPVNEGQYDKSHTSIADVINGYFQFSEKDPEMTDKLKNIYLRDRKTLEYYPYEMSEL